MLAIQRNKTNARAGFDLTFCAPMSFSLCFANADEKQRESILSAHRRAVNIGMSVYIPWNGYAGTEIKEHVVCRNGDPAVHTHLYTEMLSGLEAFMNRKEADVRYLSALAKNMQELGYIIDNAPQRSIR